ncbi:hormone-sensitive lipase-like [Centruroides sculpturatus]|uniref:hormone-sensitive lipase-like n=1 Tax=Centruroides sculpturatus TaxID=218467 RepID=UPI000C6D0C4C|nr:hormone-sensitive lipase-like [Centruroides sculpturatus]
MFHQDVSCDSLPLLITNNLAYFREDPTSLSPRYVDALNLMLEHYQWISVHVDSLCQVVMNFDFDEKTPGNGYRSYLYILNSHLNSCWKLCKTLVMHRESIFFRSEHYLKELEAHTGVFGGLRVTLAYLFKMLVRSKKGELFTCDGHLTATELLQEYCNIDQTGFYGRCHGFYYCESMRKTLRGVNVILASFSDLYQLPGGAVSHAVASVVNGGKYIVNPELRAQQIVYVAQNASVEFLKAFWSLNETQMMKNVPNLLCPTPTVREEIYVPAEAINVPSVDGNELIEIPVPTSHLPTAAIRCRLLSYVRREGQNSSTAGCRTKVAPLSPAILLHCHGGGFIAQTPESHEVNLSEIGLKELNIPVLSIDYSLAPAAPFPRALEEILLVYAWVLENGHKLGFNGEKICLVGDSAGGNLMTALTLKTIELGIRKPDALFCAYTPMILDMVPSPSRMLSAMDPLLPLGFMLSCLNAYVGMDKIQDDEYCDKESSAQPENARRISAILDSGIQMLKELEKMDIEGQSNSSPTDSISSKSEVDCPNISLSENRSENVSEIDQMTTEDYVTEFMNKYMVMPEPINLDDKTDGDEHLLYDFPTDISYSVHRRYCRMMRQYWDRLSNFIADSNLYKNHFSSKDVLKLNEAVKGSMAMPWYRVQKHTLAKKFEKIKVIMNNPFISPFSASDEMLSKMPPVYLMSTNFDPCLDDTIMFGRRLKSLGKTVHVDIVDKLPHGFLNFLPFCKEAHDGSRLCVQRIREALQLES